MKKNTALIFFCTFMSVMSVCMQCVNAFYDGNKDFVVFFDNSFQRNAICIYERDIYRSINHAVETFFLEFKNCVLMTHCNYDGTKLVYNDDSTKNGNSDVVITGQELNYRDETLSFTITITLNDGRSLRRPFYLMKGSIETTRYGITRRSSQTIQKKIKKYLFSVFQNNLHIILEDFGLNKNQKQINRCRVDMQKILKLLAQAK